MLFAAVSRLDLLFCMITFFDGDIFFHAFEEVVVVAAVEQVGDDFFFQAVVDLANFLQLLFLKSGDTLLCELVMQVGDHVGDFALQELFGFELLGLDFLNGLETLPLPFPEVGVELGYEGEQDFFCVLDFFPVDVSHVVEFVQLRRGRLAVVGQVVAG